jgi:hypothetical protein
MYQTQLGRAAAQAVSGRLGFEPRSGHVGFVVDKVALGQVRTPSGLSLSPPQIKKR